MGVLLRLLLLEVARVLLLLVELLLLLVAQLQVVDNVVVVVHQLGHHVAGVEVALGVLALGLLPLPLGLLVELMRVLLLLLLDLGRWGRLDGLLLLLGRGPLREAPGGRARRRGRLAPPVVVGGGGGRRGEVVGIHLLLVD